MSDKQKSTNLRDNSRLTYEPPLSGMSLEAISTGCLQRIADAMEVIAQDYRTLLRERDYYKRELEAARERLKTQKRQIAAYKGQLRKIKKGKAKQ